MQNVKLCTEMKQNHAQVSGVRPRLQMSTKPSWNPWLGHWRLCSSYSSCCRGNLCHLQVFSLLKYFSKPFCSGKRDSKLCPPTTEREIKRVHVHTPDVIYNLKRGGSIHQILFTTSKVLKNCLNYVLAIETLQCTGRAFHNPIIRQ